MELSPARTHLFSGGDSNRWDRFGERAAQPDAGPHGDLTNRARLLPITAKRKLQAGRRVCSASSSKGASCPYRRAPLTRMRFSGLVSVGRQWTSFRGLGKLSVRR